MPEPPELVYETVAPAEILQRLDRVRERFRTGLITVNDFNASLKAFQFSDDLGRVWSPGATTSQWYRWDLDQWTTADPPEVLRVPQSPVLFTDFEVSATSWRPPAPSAPVGVICPKCGAENPGRKFCTACGTRLDA